MKKSTRKLVLGGETIRTLSKADFVRAVGGESMGAACTEVQIAAVVSQTPGVNTCAGA